MRLDEALKHFKTNKAGLAKIIGVQPSAVQNWQPAIPLDKAALLNKLSYGALEIDWSLYDERGKPKREPA